MIKKNRKMLLNSESNSFLDNLEQDKWNDLQAIRIENESAWRNTAIIAIIALVIVAIYAMFMVNQDKHKVIVFEKNNQGNLTVLGLATKTMNLDNKVIAHQLVNFITALREVPSDLNVKRRNITLVHDMVDPKLLPQVDQMIINQYTKAKTGQISVEVNNVKPLEGGKTWEIRWTEKSSNNADGTGGMTNWDTTLTFKQLETLDPTVQILNPAGIFITYLNPTQDINEK